MAKLLAMKFDEETYKHLAEFNRTQEIQVVMDLILLTNLESIHWDLETIHNLVK